MKECDGLRAKTYSYLKNNTDEYKKVEGTKKCVISRKLKFEDYTLRYLINRERVKINGEEGGWRSLLNLINRGVKINRGVGILKYSLNIGSE